MSAILSVRQVTEQVRQAVEGRFPYVWVRGEVTNLSRPSSGHVYFSLKEDDSLLNCVWFRNQQKEEAFDPLTGEVWEDGPRPSLARSMENGQTVICAGRLTVYGARGQYQMIVDLGQALNPNPVDGMRTFITGLRKAGVKDDVLNAVTRKTPAMLLGLD